MKTSTELLIQNQALVNTICEFYFSKAINPNLHNKIKQKLTSFYGNKSDTSRLNLGLLSEDDFAIYTLSENNNFGAIPKTVVSITLKILEEELLIDSIVWLGNKRKAYTPINERVKFCEKLKITHNIIFGFEYMATRYRESVFMIEHTNKEGDIALGTGFIAHGLGKPMIITNEHVVSNPKKLRLLDVNEKEYEFELLWSDSEKDVAFLELKIPYPKDNILFFENKISILSEIITIGYPYIPRTIAPYQVLHKGEVNSFVQDYKRNNLFLISAKTSSGNSGSPVLDKNGRVIGMLVEELFEEESWKTQGKPPYFAVIPSSEILKLMLNLYKK